MIKCDTVTGNKAVAKYMRKGVSRVDFAENFAKISEEVKKKLSEEISKRNSQRVYVPEYFRSFAEDFSVNNRKIFGRSVSLCVERDETVEGKALLLVSLLHPTMNKDASKMLVCGDFEKLLEYMNNKNFSKEFERAVLELSESLKKQG